MNVIKNKKITLKEQHKLMKLLKNQDKIPEEQLSEIMNSIQNLFRDNTVDWVDAEFEEVKSNEIFLKLKEAIINQQLIQLKIETVNNELLLKKVIAYLQEQSYLGHHI